MLIQALDQASETTAGGNGALMSIIPLGFGSATYQGASY